MHQNQQENSQTIWFSYRYSTTSQLLLAFENNDSGCQNNSGLGWKLARNADLTLIWEKSSESCKSAVQRWFRNGKDSEIS